jgi:predicted DNA-binding transcriptional regulator YafY
MRRSDRLFDLIQILRDGRLHRAADLALRMGVSDRTVWRDMATLMASGLPIEGERGMGYILRAPITLPPMMLTAGELDALRQGLRHMIQSGDDNTARAARSLAAKIASVTPIPTAPLQEAGPEEDDPFLITERQPLKAAPHLPLLRRAIKDRECLSLTYLEVAGSETHADIHPMRLQLAGKTWSLQAWDTALQTERSFRLDRIMALGETGEGFSSNL